jgi:hypothetical protein
MIASLQDNNRVKALSGRCHRRLSTAANSGDMSVGRDVPWRVSTGEQVAKANNTHPIKQQRFMGTKIKEILTS